MRIALAILLLLHALIHLMGFAKAFGYAPLPQLTLPISRPMGVLWLAATVLLLAALITLFAAPRWFWAMAALGIVVSQLVIVTSFRDAKFGTVANVLTLAAAVYGAAAWGPFGLRAQYAARASQAITRLARTSVVTEQELAPLPRLVQRYLRYVGAVGQPHVGAFRVRFSGRLRSGPEAAWMEFTGEQLSVLDPPTRLFSMQATMHGLPVEALHTYDEQGARMQVKLLSLVPIVDAQGPDFTRTETVTVFNDMCVMAPATLLDPRIRWRELDEHSVEATYSNGRHTIRAVLIFDDAGALVNFWSDDRPALAADGARFVPQRWSTPIADYRTQGPFRLASRGEARYAPPSGEYAYIQFDGLQISYDIGPPGSGAPCEK